MDLMQVGEYTTGRLNKTGRTKEIRLKLREGILLYIKYIYSINLNFTHQE